MNNEKKIEKIDEQIAQVESKLRDPNLCKGTASTMTRVSGYYRAVECFNTGKTQEVADRKTYAIA